MPRPPPNGKRKREDGLEDRSTKRPKTADITSWTTPRYPWLASIESASEVGIEHVLALCSLGPLAKTRLCPNKFKERANSANSTTTGDGDGDGDGDVINVSDSDEDEATTYSHCCSKVKCKNNPYCLNYLGQEKWENQGQSPLSLAYFGI